MTDYESFFASATGGLHPYPYQRALAEGDWPDLLDVPTGLGKTAGVTLAWLYRRRLLRQADVPRRLVWCLPMRVLVEQTRRTIEDWLRALGMSALEDAETGVPVHVLMGGEPGVREASWTLAADRDAILIGTQDMLLSRALMRGYGMSRYQWPVHFALLHNDAQWVFDEVQLMGPAIATSAQLEGLRRVEALAPSRPARSLWVSATLNPSWIDTVDLRPHRAALRTLRLTDEERALPAVRKRLAAPKQLAPARTRLDAAASTQTGITAYAKALAEEILERRVPGTTTLAVVNTVARAQALFDALREQSPDASVLLVHGRFRRADRKTLDERLVEEADAERIIVATQAIEAGVDLSSRTLFTELAPWSSLVQRFGRCNRAGEHTEAEVYWIDADADDKLAAPYDTVSLDAARAHLERAGSASPDQLAPTDAPAPHGLVLRRRDLLELFNTDPDLSGMDIDVSPWVRDLGTPGLQVFWREFDEVPVEQAQPSHAELCAVSMGQVRQFLGGKRRAWNWDSLAGTWREAPQASLRPGMTLLLRASDGGYDAQRGFSPALREAVPPVPDVTTEPVANYDGDADSAIGCFVGLTEHLGHVAEEAARLATALELDARSAEVLETAGRWHDVGKAHPAFQHALIGAAHSPPQTSQLWAKSDGSGRLAFAVPGEGDEQVPRPHFRHELASLLAWLEHGTGQPDHDLVAYLIAAHHGKVRLGLRALPGERRPPDGQRHARGVWEGDRLPEVRLNGAVVPETTLRLGVMELGRGAHGPSWAERTQRLLAEHGPFRLAWLEALVRIADWRASRAEREAGARE